MVVKKVKSWRLEARHFPRGSPGIKRVGGGWGVEASIRWPQGKGLWILTGRAGTETREQGFSADREEGNGVDARCKGSVKLCNECVIGIFGSGFAVVSGGPCWGADQRSQKVKWEHAVFRGGGVGGGSKGGRWR